MFNHLINDANDGQARDQILGRSTTVLIPGGRAIGLGLRVIESIKRLLQGGGVAINNGAISTKEKEILMEQNETTQTEAVATETLTAPAKILLMRENETHIVAYLGDQQIGRIVRTDNCLKAIIDRPGTPPSATELEAVGYTKPRPGDKSWTAGTWTAPVKSFSDAIRHICRQPDLFGVEAFLMKKGSAPGFEGDTFESIPRSKRVPVAALPANTETAAETTTEAAPVEPVTASPEMATPPVTIEDVPPALANILGYEAPADLEASAEAPIEAPRKGRKNRGQVVGA